MKRLTTLVCIAGLPCLLHAQLKENVIQPVQSVNIDYGVFDKDVNLDSDKAEFVFAKDGIISEMKFSKMNSGTEGSKEYEVVHEGDVIRMLLAGKEVASFTIDKANAHISGTIECSYTTQNSTFKMNQNEMYEIADSVDRRTLYFTTHNGTQQSEYAYTFEAYTSDAEAEYKELHARQLSSLTHFNSTDFAWDVYKNYPASYRLKCRQGDYSVSCKITSSLFPQTEDVNAINLCILFQTQYVHQELAIPFVTGMCPAYPSAKDTKKTDAADTKKKSTIFSPYVCVNDGLIGGGIFYQNDTIEPLFALDVMHIDLGLGKYLPGICINPFAYTYAPSDGGSISFLNAYIYQPLSSIDFDKEKETVRLQINAYGGIKWLGPDIESLEYRAGIITSLQACYKNVAAFNLIGINCGVGYKNDNVYYYGTIVTSPSVVGLLPALSTAMYAVLVGGDADF